MEFVKRLLKSSIKSCISRFLQNDIELHQMAYQEGIFELSKFLLNCNEINKHIQENSDMPILCKKVEIGSMKIHPSWGNLIQKMEFSDTFIHLGQYGDSTDPQDTENPTNGNNLFFNNIEETEEGENSIFFYEHEGHEEHNVHDNNNDVSESGGSPRKSQDGVSDAAGSKMIG